MRRFLKALAATIYIVIVMIAMIVVGKFPSPWSVVAQIAVLLTAIYIITDGNSRKE